MPSPNPTPRSASGSAPGKLILAGEHAVVYGHRAIAAAVPLFAHVTLTEQPGPLCLDPLCLDPTRTTDDRLLTALGTLLPADGLCVSVRSELPVGAGMGSSAAIAVATVRAWGALHGESPGPDTCFERAWAMERVFHGNPSGVDHAVSARGGVLRYRRDPFEVSTLRLARPLRLVVVHTGPPAWTTAQMVAGVRDRAPWATLDRIGALAERVDHALSTGAAVGPLLSENHAMLQEIGVSTHALDEACISMCRAGASGAKLAGAGGGGIAFAVVEAGETAPVLDAARRFGPAWELTVAAA